MTKFLILIPFLLAACGKPAPLEDTTFLCFTPTGPIQIHKDDKVKVRHHKESIIFENDTTTLTLPSVTCMEVTTK